MSLLKESKMKPFTIAIVCLVLIAGVSGCKRSAAFDPGADGPAAYQITLKGTANPSTLFIPHNEPQVQSVITVRAIHNDGSPVVGREVYLTKDSELGHFANLRDSVTRETDANGEVQVLFLVPAGTVLPATITMHIEARIHDDTRLDNPISEIYDFIPIKVMPAEIKKITLCGKVKLAFGEDGEGTGIPNAVVMLTDSVTGWPMVHITRPSGSWCAEVDYGWMGTITASLSGYTFSPTSYTYGVNNPVSESRYDLDFISTSLPSLVVNPSALSFGVSTNDQRVSVNSSPSGVQISYYATSSDTGWLTIRHSDDATDRWDSTDLITGPNSIIIRAETNPIGNAARSGYITLTPSDPDISPVQIAVDQEGDTP
ncbi:MAG: hypothetical protein RB296_05320 [Acidobacteriota bacterium]|jgi:hypothetical protein|nr:hypothetical protein [Acidobacteriota bacterium]